MQEPLPRSTLGELARRALAASVEERAGLIAQLGHGSRSVEQIAAISERFLTLGPAGQLALLEWIVHVRPSLPEGILLQARTLLSDRTIPAPVRVNAAARLLKELPDKTGAVLKIARPLTAGLSPLRRLERLRQLQHQVDQNRSLDAILERREQRLKMDCPRCGQRFPRETMVRHLWHEHGLFLERGKVRSPKRTIEELKSEHATTHDTTVLDRTSLLAGTDALRAWVASSEPTPEDVAPLLTLAEMNGAGLCPECFAEVLPAVPPMPAPLSLSMGRLAGAGYFAAIGGAEWLRTLTIATPREVLHSGPDGHRALGTRGIAMLTATLLLVLAILVAVLGPKEWASPTMIFRLVVASALGYGLVWFVRKPPPNPTDRAVDAAWNVLARWLLGEADTTEWLARLCRASAGHGDPIARTGILTDLIARARAGRSTADLQLLAAGEVLLVEDGSRQGRDRVAGLAGLAAKGFRGEESIEYSEFVAECFLNRIPEPSAGERARFRTLLLGAAFEAGLKPRDLIDLWIVAPNLRQATIVEPLHRLALLQGVWAMRAARRWERIAPADSAFDLCRIAPHASGRILAEFPDLLLFHRPDPDTESQLGPVLICARGIAIGGHLIADPDAEVSIEKSGRFGGGYELIFGPHRLPLERQPVGNFAEVIKEWLRFRAWALLPLLDNYLAPSALQVAERMMRPFVCRCANCGTRSAIALGKVGRRV